MIGMYDPTKTFEDNYEHGPFGAFATKPQELPKTHTQVDFFGRMIDIPFGIPAGPLLTGAFIRGAWAWGYSVPTYKTIRPSVYPCHPFPNILTIDATHDVHTNDTVISEGNHQDIDVTRQSITNSFGVPSYTSDTWMPDASSVATSIPEGNSFILSFMGTKKEGMTREQFIEDNAEGCRLAKNTGAPVLEINFSCPNVGAEGLICNDVTMSTNILEACAAVRGQTPLLVKIGYFPPEQQEHLEKLVLAVAHFGNGICAINTIQAKVINPDGSQALPGSPVRIMSGICGKAITWAGLDMVGRINALREKHHLKDFTLIGVGGVVSVDDYVAYRQAGADVVQSATGAMWRPELAMEIRRSAV
jgi:dihydroorotate dehydrogenase